MKKNTVWKNIFRVNELAGEVAVATATLGQTAKEMTKETPELKDHNGKLLGGALKVKVKKNTVEHTQLHIKIYFVAQVVHGTSRMVATAKILAPVVTDAACR